MSTYVLHFQELDRTKLIVAGGKAANLGELYKIKGIQVPEGFCVTTEAYKRITGQNHELTRLINELANLKTGERKYLCELC